MAVSIQGDVHEDVRFVEVSEGPEFRTGLAQALREGVTAALGLLGWELQESTLQAKRGMFPWHDCSLRKLFDRMCEEGVERVGEEFELGQK